jgi:hypothetical protein
MTMVLAIHALWWLIFNLGASILIFVYHNEFNFKISLLFNVGFRSTKNRGSGIFIWVWTFVIFLTRNPFWFNCYFINVTGVVG